MEQQGERTSVLLVEDEVLLRLAIADELRQAGMTVLEAATADEAATILESHPDRVGVVLTDIQMPGSMDGRALVRLVRARFPGVAVVVLSGAQPQMLSGLDADVVFSKPHHPDRLIASIKKLLAGRAGNGSTNNNARHR